MDALAEPSTDKDESSLNYPDTKFEERKQANLLTSDHILSSSTQNVSLPPPLPGVFVFDQPNQKSNPSLIDSNFTPLITSSYDNNPQTVGSNEQPDSNTYQKLKYPDLNQPAQKINADQKYFHSQALNVYDYHSSERALQSKLSSAITNEIDSMLPSEGNFYQTLQPVSVNAFDTSLYSEQKVYQQLETVSRNDYRVDMKKFVEEKFYKELNPISSSDSKIPKREKKTYQQLGLAPNLEFAGRQCGFSNARTVQQKPDIPPEYATSKLYQELSKPPKKQMRRSHPLDTKSYHELRPAGYVEKPKHNLSRSLGQIANLNNPRAFVAHTNSKVHTFYQDKTDYPQFDEVVHSVEVRRYSNNPHVISPAPKIMSIPSSQNHEEHMNRGFQEHKPKVYLELRNSGRTTHKCVPSEGVQRNLSVCQPITSSYTSDNVANHTEHQNTHFSLQAHGKQSNIRLPNPYESTSVQFNASDAHKTFGSLEDSSYKDSQIEKEKLNKTIPNTHSFNVLNKETPSVITFPDEVTAGFKSNLDPSIPQKTPAHYSVPSASNTDKIHEDLNQAAFKNEKNQFPDQLNLNSAPTPTGVSKLVDQSFTNHNSNNNLLQNSDSLVVSEIMENITQESDNLVAKESSCFADKNNCISDNSSSDPKTLGTLLVSYEKTFSDKFGSEIFPLQDTNSPVEEKNKVSLDSNLESTLNSSKHSYTNSLNLNSYQSSSKNKIILNQASDGDLSDVLTAPKSVNSVAINETNENGNVIADSVTSYNFEQTIGKRNNHPQKIENSLFEDPSDLTVNNNDKSGDTSRLSLEKGFATENESVSKLFSETKNKVIYLSGSDTVARNHSLRKRKQAKTFQNKDPQSTITSPSSSNSLTSQNLKFIRCDSSEVLIAKESHSKDSKKSKPLKATVSSENLESGHLLPESILPDHGFVNPETFVPLTIDKSATENSAEPLLNIVESKLNSKIKAETQLNNGKEIECKNNKKCVQLCESKYKKDLVKENEDISEKEQPKVHSKFQSNEKISLAHTNKLETDLEKVKEEKDSFQYQSQNFSSYQYTAFLPKKNRILRKMQISGNTKSSSKTLEDSKSNFPKYDLFSSEEKHASSESLKTLTPECTLTENTLRVPETQLEEKKINIPENSGTKSTLSNKSSKLSLKIDENESFKSFNSDKLAVSFQNHLQNESKPTFSEEVTHLSIKHNVGLSNASTNDFPDPKIQSKFTDEEIKAGVTVPDTLKKSVPILEKQSDIKKDSRPVPKKHKLLQSDQSYNNSRRLSFKEEEISSNKLQTIKEVISGSKSCGLVSATEKIDNYNEEKEESDATCRSQGKSESTKVLTKQNGDCLKIQPSKSKEIENRYKSTNVSNADSTISVNDDELTLQSLGGRSSLVSVTDGLSAFNHDFSELNSHKADVKCHPEKFEKQSENEKCAANNTNNEINSIDNGKSNNAHVIQEKTYPIRKRTYRKTKKREVLSALRNPEPLLRSKYSKRIIKKKKLDYEPIEKTKKNKVLLKRKYTKHKKQPPTNDINEDTTKNVKNLIPMSSDAEYKFVDPLESINEAPKVVQEGLITEDEEENIFLGFDSPPEEDEAILGFDFKAESDDESLEPINAFLQQLDADCVTVECDPRSLLQAPRLTTQCPQCDKALDSHQGLVDHLQWHSTLQNSDSHACGKCQREFGTRAQLEKHIKWNHEGGKRFACPVCPKRFTTSNYIEKHLATVHKRRHVEQKYKCPECSRFFLSTKKLKKHEEKVHKKTLYQCDTCLKNFLKQTNLERHKLSHEREGQKFPCAYCSEKFESRAKLHAHWPTHSEKKLFTCDICNKIFTALPSLKRHKILHVGEKVYRCEICQKAFTLMSTLKTHLLIHTGVKRFPCKLCDKTFNRQDVLNAHQWIHTGEKKFECDICFQKFRWRHAVKSHKLIYHSTEKPFGCEVCGKRFSHPESFKKHGEVHAEKMFYCQICLKAFSRPSSLKTHILIHTDLKPFICDLCNRSFRHKGHLQKHFLVHTNEKSWLCKFCNKMYKDRNQLRRHKSVVHCKKFFKKVLPEVPEDLKTMENFEILAESETASQRSEECSQDSIEQNSGNLMSQSSKHFILGLTNSGENSNPDTMESDSSDLFNNEIASANENSTNDVGDNTNSTDNEDFNNPLNLCETVLPPSAF